MKLAPFGEVHMAPTWIKFRTGTKSVPARWALAVLALATILSSPARADRPYAPNHDYDLQNVRVALRFDVDQHEVLGVVTHTLAALHDGVTHLDFDSSELTIRSAKVNGKDATFALHDDKLQVNLAAPAKAGEHFDVEIAYDGKPTSGVYFVLPDKDNPTRAKEIWTQGESEDTHHYIPIYDYPNDRTTVDMILTVPADWLTVSNGNLVSVADGAGGVKTWTWREPQPVSTYLISFVVGEFKEKKDMWHNIPVSYAVPKGMEDTLDPTFTRTRDMLDFFSERFGVAYPWEKYSQTAVDDFVVSGMENVSATTLAARDMVHAGLAGERAQASDVLLSHEMSHQWFGDLVTCQDWGHMWLNEGFATFAEALWIEHAYGSDASNYEYWRNQNGWMPSKDLFTVPIVTHDFTDSDQYVGNVYDKAGWVLRMLREKLGDQAFFTAVTHYLETHRLQNVVTADLIKSIEESSGTDVAQFFDQWVYGAGAPRFVVRSTYDDATKNVSLSVKQTQKVEGAVGLFNVPIEVAITTANGQKLFPIAVSKADETFTIPVDGQPLMVLFDKGDKIMKSLDFQKSPEELIRQMSTAQDMSDRADAALALGSVKDNDMVTSALGESARHDSFWGVREEALRALGRINSPAARTQIADSLTNEQPWVRLVAVQQLGRFHDEDGISKRLEAIYKDDKAYTVRGMALQSLAVMKAHSAEGLLKKAASTDSPGDTLRSSALRAMGSLNDNDLVPTLLEWSGPGKPSDLRSIAIGSLGSVDKKNHDITARLISYLNESSFDIRFSTIYALGRRGDAAAIEPLEALVKEGKLSISMPHRVEQLIEQIRAANAPKKDTAAADPKAGETGQPSASAVLASNQAVLDRLDRLEHQMTDINAQLVKIQASLSPSKSD